MTRTFTVLVLTLVSCSHVPPVSWRASNTRGIVLSLDSVEPVVAVGAVPRFRLTLSNVSGEAIRILDAEQRVDLQHTYYDLVVTRDGKPVDVPRAISDPGPVSDADWLVIPPGSRKVFILADFPEKFEVLPPGVYEAYVDFWRDPYQSHDTAYRSAIAKFTVRK